jgi:hypothetical protein
VIFRPITLSDSDTTELIDTPPATTQSPNADGASPEEQSRVAAGGLGGYTWPSEELDLELQTSVVAGGRQLDPSPLINALAALGLVPTSTPGVINSVTELLPGDLGATIIIPAGVSYHSRTDRCVLENGI